MTRDRECHSSVLHSLGKHDATTSTCAANAVVLESTLHKVCASIVYVQHIIFMEAGASSAC